jgi:Sec-independent protein translocase protein TatA
MSFALLIALFVVAFVVFLLFLARAYPGTGADLVDWDPGRRAEARMASEEEDMAQMLEIENRKRRAAGKDEVTEDDLRYGPGV